MITTSKEFVLHLYTTAEIKRVYFSEKSFAVMYGNEKLSQEKTESTAWVKAAEYLDNELRKLLVDSKAKFVIYNQYAVMDRAFFNTLRNVNKRVGNVKESIYRFQQIGYIIFMWIIKNII
jgi:hypothetical protein